MKLYTALITSYECNGNGPRFLHECLESVFTQTYRPIQCIVSDHSRDDKIEKMVATLDSKGVELIYVRYSENYGNPCHNWNNALRYATGQFLHYIAMDDRLAHPGAVSDVIAHMETTGAQWTATVCQFDPRSDGIHIPRWTGNILHENTIGGPTKVVIRDTLKHIKMDPAFIWVLDMDWFHRLAQAAGPPSFFINSITYIDRHHPDQLTKQLTTPEKEAEHAAILAKYGTGKHPT
jgi:glycosyltransferase involved in cell wall biosynthesis